MSSAPSTLLAPAQSLDTSAQQLELVPLAANDPRYTPLGAARGTKELTALETYLRSSARTASAFAKCAFIGNRGSGKSTYLRYLEHQLEQSGSFTTVHIELDPSLEADCDYSELFLWMVDEIARQFSDRGHPVSDDALNAVADWFAERSKTTTIDVKKEISASAEASASSNTGIPGFLSFKLLARLKSMIVGSQTSRQEIRQQVQNYATELRERMNDFLEEARAALRSKGKPDRLLIVQDNLDRIKSRDAAQRLFDNGGDMLIGIRADVIYTAPLALNMAPFDIGRTFGHVFTMPNVKVKRKDGKVHKPGIEGLTELISKRLSIDLVFENEKVVRHLVEKSGGSVRDLLRLLDSAQLAAQVDGKQRVDMGSAKAAVRKMVVNFTRLLTPSSAYYPILAEVHRTKREYSLPEGEVTRERVNSAREFFAEMIGNGSVLEYNGEDSWYDAHPAVCDTDQFKDACRPAVAK